MATVKVKFRASSVSGRPGSIFYQLCHGGKVRQLASRIRIQPQYSDLVCEGSGKDGVLVEDVPAVRAYRARIKNDLSRLERIIRTLEDCGGEYGLDEVVAQFKGSDTQTTVASFFREMIAQCRRNKTLGTARNYERTLRSFMDFLNGEDIHLSQITDCLVADYEAWMLGKGIMRNSSSFYLRNLRSVYNKAVKRSLTEQKYPFQDVYTGIDRTRKRAVDEDIVLRLQSLDLGNSQALAFSRDLFIFSFCTRGMAFVDIAFLRKSDVANGVISYVRRKTGQQLFVRIEPCMEQIIRRYAGRGKDSPYVFPILTASSPEEAYRQYQAALTYHNRKLKRLGRELGENLSLSSYTSRHTWATAARKHNVPLSVISEGMGHSSERTTRIYLAALENSVIDEANRDIVRRLNGEDAAVPAKRRKKLPTIC